MEDKHNILFSKEEIAKRIEELGAVITNDYKDKNLYVLSLLRGSFIFTADIVRAINTKTKIGFMTTSSYGNETTSSGRVKIVSDIPDDYYGLMGVPDTFLDCYNPEQFEIVGLGVGNLAKQIGVKKNYRGRTDVAYKDKNGKDKCPFSRIIIRRIDNENSNEWCNN